MKKRKRGSLMTFEEKREAAEASLQAVFGEWVVEDFDETYDNGVNRIRITLARDDIDASESLSMTKEETDD